MMKVHAACYYECGTCSLICIEVCTSVSDPYWFQYGSGSIILGQYGSGSGSRSVSGFGSRYFRDQNERNLIENFFFLFLSFIAFTHWLGTSRLKLKPSGPQQMLFWTWNHIFLSLFGHHSDSPGSGSVFPKRIRIRIHGSHDLDPKHWFVLAY